MAHAHQAAPTEGRRNILREPEVKQRTGKSRAQRWRDIRDGRFPAPVELGRNSIGWFEDEVEAWLAARPRRRYGSPEAARTLAATQAAPIAVIPKTAPRKRVKLSG